MEPDLALAEPYSRAREVGAAVWGNGWVPVRYSSAPGRIEVLGNHVDYNGGPVLAAAIDRTTVVLADEPEPTLDVLEIVLADTNRATPFRISPTELIDWRNSSKSQRPADFVRGAVAALMARDKRIGLARFVVASSVPIGVGVSSSAALCVALSMALCREGLEFEELVLIAQDAEHRAGTPCGTMDQSTSVAGGMIRFDGSNLGIRQLDPVLEGHAFLVIDSGVKRSLVNSSYPRRVAECRQALTVVNDLLGSSFPSLASVRSSDLKQVEHIQGSNMDPTLFRRARHIVTEVERVNKAESALSTWDWALFGRLMTESGRSSATDYDMSHPIVEDLVQRLSAVPGVCGVRMMGGGEGGSLIALIEPDDRGEIRERVLSVIHADRKPDTSPRSAHRFNFASGARCGQAEEILFP